jgi:asparagine synthase (glutamine-hydrolysing)
MSGIAGIVRSADPPVSPCLLAKMAASLTRRGPDAGGTWAAGGAALVYTLLGGNARAEHALVVRGQLAIVADAHVDAKDELLRKFDVGDRQALLQATDPELILSCYERWGEECLDHLIGEFSFAIWDAGTRSLFCARDQFGVKPLFYASTRDAFLFSNTLDCLRVHPEVGPELDRLAIADFLLFGQYLDPAATAFSQLRRLPAGHSLRWHSGATEIRRYWTLPYGGATRFESGKEYIDGFSDLLNRAVADRTHPAGTAILMSGGLDSTMVAAVASGQACNVKAFAMVYDRLIPDPERHYAQVAADALRIPLECLAADDYRLFERAPGAERCSPEPVDEPVPAAFTQHLAQVRAHSHVALTGVGGDSLLLGSSGFAVELLKSGQLARLAGGLSQFVRLRRQIPPVGFRGAMLRRLGLRRQAAAPFPPWLNPDLVRELGLAERWQRFAEPKEVPGPMERPEAYQVLTDPGWARIFESYDAGVTGIPVDVRHPLFDLRLVNYCMGIPPIPWCVDKTLARVAMRNRLPEAVRMRPKSFAADAVAVRLAASPWIDRWRAAADLSRFVDRSRVPILAEAGAGWDPHHRPFALNQWLSNLTTNRG